MRPGYGRGARKGPRGACAREVAARVCGDGMWAIELFEGARADARGLRGDGRVFPPDRLARHGQPRGEAGARLSACPGSRRAVPGSATTRPPPGELLP